MWTKEHAVVADAEAEFVAALQGFYVALASAGEAIQRGEDAQGGLTVEAPHPAVQSRVAIAGHTYGSGSVAYGPVNTPLVLNGAYMGNGGTVQFTGYYKNASGQEVVSGTVQATVTMWTPTMLFFYVPSGAVSGLVTVIVDGKASNALPFLVTPGSYGSSCPANATTSQLQILTSSLPSGAVGQSYSTTLQASDGTAPYTWSLTTGALPAGLSLSPGGVISGTPSSASGPVDFTVTAVDSRSQSADAVLSLSVDSLTLTSGTVYSYSATYDGVGNVLGYDDSVNGTWSSINYDPLSRLIQATLTPTGGQALSFTWSYDSFGNRISQQESYTSGALLATEVNSYNGANQITRTNARGITWAPSYDGAGNMLSDGANTYLYDAEGRVCAVLNRAMPSMPLMTGYLYDADGNRVAKGTISTMSCDPATNGFQFTENYVLGPSGEELTMLDGSNTWQRTNVYVGGRLMATYDQAGLHFHLTDPLGTRRVQLSGNLTSSDQTLPLGQAELDCQSLPYGDQQSCTPAPNAPPSSDDATPLHFTGKERDTESGNDYFGARYYSSSMGRFMSPDPFLNSGRPDNPQTWNRYTYGLNNPLRNTDPTGLYTCSGDKSQCSGVSDALKAAQGALGNLKKGSAEYNALSSAINAYGKAGVDNGVHVGFGATSGAASTTVGVLADASGNKMTTADNPTGQNINVTVDPSKNGSTNQEAINLAHEGSHVADGSALVGALPMNLSGSDAVLGGALNMTSYQTEMKAYGVSSYTAQGLGLGSLSVGNGNVIWNASWGAVDRQTLRTQGIQHELADPKGLYNVTPDNQGHKLIQ